MRYLALALTVLIVGCAAKEPTLQLGGGAKLVDPNGADIVFETGRPRKPKRTRVPSGTEVVVLAIDGDLARVSVKEGPHAGLIDWVQLGSLDPLAP